VLVQLRIVDYAIIEELEFRPGRGFNVLTGETGAGKSIIIGALGLLRGGRANADAVRSGANEAVIEALFDLTAQPQSVVQLEALGFPAGDELLVRRVVPKSGRGRVYINGSLATVAVLAQLMGELLEITGQHESRRLADRVTQRLLVDSIALSDSLKKQMSTAYRELAEIADALERTQLDDRQRLERIDFLKFQLQELSEAQLSPGEDVELDQLLSKLQRAADLRGAASKAEQVLVAQDGAVCERIAAIQRELDELSTVDPKLSPLAAQLDESRVLLEDAALSLGRYAGSVDVDPRALAEAEARYELLRRLTRKHGATVDELIERTVQMQRELAELEGIDERRDELAQKLDSAREKARGVATKCSQKRKSSAKRISKEISGNLGELGMKGAQLEVAVEPALGKQGDRAAFLFGDKRLSEHGWDRVEFLVSTNAGEPMHSIGRVASGGELSRITLALRQVIGQHDPVSISVFDEVDSGISGAVADVVGRCLAAVSAHRQVLVVTHLPQVAAFAARHFHVGKARAKGRTTTRLTQLDGDDRVEALAKMLAAKKVTEAARENARQLVASARA
jgi:DNA repair protein RecN (Recombination protein N)